jgi:hypothetical protein
MSQQLVNIKEVAVAVGQELIPKFEHSNSLTLNEGAIILKKLAEVEAKLDILLAGKDSKAKAKSTPGASTSPAAREMNVRQYFMEKFSNEADFREKFTTKEAIAAVERNPEYAKKKSDGKLKMLVMEQWNQLRADKEAPAYKAYEEMHNAYKTKAKLNNQAVGVEKITPDE